MSAIEITPALLADIEAKAMAAEKVSPSPWIVDWTEISDSSGCSVADFSFYRENPCEAQTLIAAADPAVMLAMIERIRQLEAAQCWAIVTIETGVIDGPYATREAAEHDRLTILQDKPDEPMYRVEPWKGGAE